MQFRHLGALLLLGAVWGSSFLFLKIAIAELPPEMVVATRLVLAALIMPIIVMARGLRLPRDLRSWRNFAISGVVGMVLPFVLITWGEQSISSGMAGILNATTPLFTVIIAAAALREEKLRGTRLLGLLIGFVGVVVAVGIDELHFGSGALWGQLAVLGSSVCYGIQGNFSRRAFRGLPALIPAAGQIITGALVIAPIALLRHGVPVLPSPTVLGALLALALLCTAVAYVLQFWLIDNVGATRTSMVTYLVAPFALLYGALFLAEPVHPQAMAGFAMVVVGILMTNGLIGRRKPAPVIAPAMGERSKP